MTITFYGNDTETKVFGANPEVVAMAADRLMPPQFDEFCAALRGEKSEATNKYWREKAEMFQEMLDE